MRFRAVTWLFVILVLGTGGAVADRNGWLTPAEGVILRLLVPIQASVRGFLQPGLDLLETAQRMGSLRAENDELKARIDELTGEVVRLREVEVENEQLRSELDYKRQNPGRQLLPARVIYRDPSNYVQAIVIDKGSDSGVAEGMTVISAGALVGKVTWVSPTLAKVLLIVDASSSVNATIQRSESRALGLVNGQPSSRLLMKYIPQTEAVKTNDIVITSGLGAGYPQGLLIGKIISVQRNDIEMFQEAVIEPAVRFGKLEQVQVITDFVPATLGVP